MNDRSETKFKKGDWVYVIEEYSPVLKCEPVEAQVLEVHIPKDNAAPVRYYLRAARGGWGWATEDRLLSHDTRVCPTCNRKL
jgi:hypothetical protein